MNDRSRTSNQPTLPGMASAISSPESADGRSRCDSGDGPTTGPSGPEAAPARPSPPPADSLSARGAMRETLCRALDELATSYAGIAETHGLPTPDTYGRSSGDSLRIAARKPSWENRLRDRLASYGSRWFALRWKYLDTLLGPAVFALVGSARPKSETDFGSWPAPMAGTPARNGNNEAGSTDSSRRTRQLLSGWPTPTAALGNKAVRTQQGAMDEARRKSASNDLGVAAALTAAWPGPLASTGGPEPEGKSGRKLATVAGWITPTMVDYKDGTTMAPGGPSTRLGSQVLTSLPEDPTGESSGAPLNPAFSLWLMGFPEEWLNCAPSETRSSRRRRPNS